MNYAEQQYPSARRRRMTGPFAIFGRGRMLSFVMMAVVSVFSFLSNNTNWVRPRTPIASTQMNTQVSPQSGLTMQYAQQQQQLAASRVQIAQHQQLLQSNPIQLHGGIVDDPRMLRLQQVGARLVQGVPNIPPNAVQFFVLRDNMQAASYALADGRVLVTAGLLNQIQTEEQLAAILSRRVTEVLYRGVDRMQNPQIADFPSQLVRAAGYRTTSVVPVSNYSTGNPQIASPISAGWSR